MRKCIFDGVEVDAKLVRSNSSSFGRTIANDLRISYRLELDVEDVVSSFDQYYQDFIDRESEDEGFEEALDGYFLSLKEAGYLPLTRMIVEQPDLLAQVIKDELPVEFLGSVFQDKGASVGSKRFILQNMVNVQISDGKFICEGNAFLNPRYSAIE